MQTTLDKIGARDFTYVSAYYGGADTGEELRFEKFLVGSPFTDKAMERAKAYCETRLGGQPREIKLYPRNYVRKARALAAEGRVDWI